MEPAYELIGPEDGRPAAGGIELGPFAGAVVGAELVFVLLGDGLAGTMRDALGVADAVFVAVGVTVAHPGPAGTGDPVVVTAPVDNPVPEPVPVAVGVGAAEPVPVAVDVALVEGEADAVTVHVGLGEAEEVSADAGKASTVL